jgi:pimeloyl-ACP methyl ester carboxylesterase
MFDSSGGWMDLVAAIPGRCLAVDLPGFGHSSAPAHPRLSAYAKDVVRGLDDIGVGSFTLIGHSLGGGVATTVAERLSSQVAALILCAPVGFGRIPLAEAAALPILRDITSLCAPHVLSNPMLLGLVYAEFVTNGVFPTRELRRRLAAGARRVRPGLRAAVEAIAAAGRAPDAFHRRSVDYGGPVTAVWGERDTIVPASHRHGVAASLPAARCEVWAGMGHHPQRERPRLLAELVGHVREGLIREQSGVGNTPRTATCSPA